MPKITFLSICQNNIIGKNNGDNDY